LPLMSLSRKESALLLAYSSQDPYQVALKRCVRP
jgi:hypothetical protein